MGGSGPPNRAARVSWFQRVRVNPEYEWPVRVTLALQAVARWRHGGPRNGGAGARFVSAVAEGRAVGVSHNACRSSRGGPS